MVAKYNYPVSQHHSQMIRTATGVNFDEITLDAVLQGGIDSGDLTVSSDTLLMQADIAEEAGFRQVAENLRRASELVRIPAEDILRIYTGLRPHRSTIDQLMLLADELEKRHEAERISSLIREAAAAYRAHGLLSAERED